MHNNKLDSLLVGEEPEDKPVATTDVFDFHPRVNVREEFVLWVMQQFPDLKKYSTNRTIYPELETRKKHVYEAALGAVNHGVLSTEACAKARLKQGWQEFEAAFTENAKPEDRAKGLSAFVRSLEDLSISLGGDEHYTKCGHYLTGTGYYSSERKNAFIYRKGDEDGEGTRYFVSEEKQAPRNSIIRTKVKPVLIGEIKNLFYWEFNRLKRTVSKFRGPEQELIKKVDTEVPENQYGFR